MTCMWTIFPIDASYGKVHITRIERQVKGFATMTNKSDWNSTPAKRLTWTFREAVKEYEERVVLSPLERWFYLGLALLFVFLSGYVYELAAVGGGMQ